jgi:hypothetical protein
MYKYLLGELYMHQNNLMEVNLIGPHFKISFSSNFDVGLFRTISQVGFLNDMFLLILFLG